MNLSTLGDSAADLLAAFVEQLNAIPGYIVPPNQYVGAGEIPWDGPGLYVYLGSTDIGQPGAPIRSNIPKVQAVFPSVTLYVMIIREVSTFGYFSAGEPAPASDEQLNAEGIEMMNDAGALIAAAIQIKKAQKIVTGPQEGFVIGAVTPVGPQGGLAAMRLMLDLTVSGP